MNDDIDINEYSIKKIMKSPKLMVSIGNKKTEIENKKK